jgi:predicted phosphoribosyltransferase
LLREKMLVGLISGDRSTVGLGIVRRSTADTVVVRTPVGPDEWRSVVGIRTSDLEIER